MYLVLIGTMILVPLLWNLNCHCGEDQMKTSETASTPDQESKFSKILRKDL